MGKNQKKILTIPNLLSFFRMCLIPVIAWLYSAKKNYVGAVVTLTVSGVTDVVDGMIARRFDRISDFGKVLDPIADKLTQFVTLVCLVARFPNMLILLVILVVKEIVSAVTGILAIKKTNQVMSSVWHGKLTTVLLYAMMILHLLWYGIPEAVSDGLVFVCTAMMLVSAVLYTKERIELLK